ncbi:hypothetical protein J6590_059119 [Homalodisca vitripennis]|nr:hypothetical protein J6590_094142 [Homalodisca vitripennis]KAG8267078.1 hypothetical protein J6590_059119 [Homalodisca vitripennis]
MSSPPTVPRRTVSPPPPMPGPCKIFRKIRFEYGPGYYLPGDQRFISNRLCRRFKMYLRLHKEIRQRSLTNYWLAAKTPSLSGHPSEEQPRSTLLDWTGILMCGSHGLSSVKIHSASVRPPRQSFVMHFKKHCA